MKYLIELVADPKGLEPAITAMAELNAKEKELKSTTTSLSAEQKKLMDSYAANAKVARPELDKMIQGYKQLGKAAAGAFSKDAVNGAAKAAESFRTQLRNSREEVTKLFMSGKATTSEIYRMARAGGELKDSIGDAQQAISVLASDTFKFDAAIQGIQVGAAGFQALTAGAALFGNESEDLQKTLVKLNGIMALTQSLQQIVNLTQKQSAFMLGVNIAAQKTYAVVVGQSTGVLKAFRIALAATGIGALILALVTLAQNWDKVKGAITGVNSELKKGIEINEKRLEVSKKQLEQFDLEEKKLRLIGIAEDEIIRKRQAKILLAMDEAKMLEKQLEKAVQQTANATAKFSILSNIPVIGSILSLFTPSDKEIQEVVQKQTDVQDEVTSLYSQFLDTQLELKAINDDKKKELDEKERERLKKLSAENEAIYKSIQERIKKNEDSFVTAEKKKQDELMETNRLLQEQADELLKLNADNQQRLKDSLDEQNAIKQANYESEIQLEKDKSQAISTAAVEIAQQTTDAIFQIVNTNRNNEFNLQIQRLNELKSRELANKELTDNQRARIEERYQRKVAELKTKQAQADKQAAIAQAIINGALAITKIFTSVTALNPASFAAIAITAASTAAQIAVISAQKIPKFAKGTEYVKGGGTETSDSVPALLSKGERVIDAKTNKLLKGIPNKMLPDLLMPSQTMIKEGMDYDKLAKALSKELSNNPALMVNFDKQGFTTFIKAGVTTSQIKNNRNGV